jgi:hypothetical protein
MTPEADLYLQLANRHIDILNPESCILYLVFCT